MSRTYKDLPIRVKKAKAGCLDHPEAEHHKVQNSRHTAVYHTNGALYTESCSECVAEQRFWLSEKNHLQAHSKGEIKLRKRMKREVTRGARRNWLDPKDYRKVTGKSINYKVWPY
jgi:hypothetical protein